MFKEKKEVTVRKVRLVIVMTASFVVLAFIVGVFWGANINTAKELKEAEEIKEETLENANQLREGYDIKEVLYDTTDRENCSIEKVELTTDGLVLVSIIEGGDIVVNRQEVQRFVNKSYMVHVGQSDVCEGNIRLVFDRGDYYSYLNIDDLVCGHMVTTGRIEEISDIVDFEEKRQEGYKYEPDSYVVYAVDSTGKKTDISNQLGS